MKYTQISVLIFTDRDPQCQFTNSYFQKYAKALTPKVKRNTNYNIHSFYK